MIQVYGNAFRRRVIEAIEGGMSRHGAARRFGIAPSTAILWMQRYTKTASYKAFKVGGHRRPILSGYEDNLRVLNQEKSVHNLSPNPAFSLPSKYQMLRESLIHYSG